MNPTRGDGYSLDAFSSNFNEEKNTEEKTIQVGQGRYGSGSSGSREFYGPVPYNVASSSMPYDACEVFDIQRLSQTSLLEFINEEEKELTMGDVSLRKVAQSIGNKVGKIELLETDQKTFLGTCTLISSDLILTARHVIQWHNMQDLEATFGYDKRNQRSVRLDCVVEDNSAIDYAIVKLEKSLGQYFGSVSLSSEDIAAAPFLLHYPLGKDLQLSMHEIQHSQYEATHLFTYYDSNYGSSGGACVDHKSNIVAVHLGSEKRQDLNTARYEITIKEIVELYPNSILQKILSQELPQDTPYQTSKCTRYLLPCKSSYEMNEEGRQSERILRDLIEDHLHMTIDKVSGIRLTRGGTIQFSDDNLASIFNNYPSVKDPLLKKCLGKVGFHGWTKQYSIKGFVASDHTLPHEAWNYTTNSAMQNVVLNGTGSQNRPGEDAMPAITIAHDKHVDLPTTRSGEFREELTCLCNDNKVPDALIQCFQDYQKHNISLTSEQVDTTLSLYKGLDVIDESNAKRVYRQLFLQREEKTKGEKKRRRY